MNASPPRPVAPAWVTIHPDGSATLIPYQLPVHVPTDHMPLTLAEWLGVDTTAATCTTP